MDFKDTTLYHEITDEIIQLWNDCDKDADMADAIQEFKTFYGNHTNSIYYYDFEIPDNLIMCCQRFVMRAVEDICIETILSIHEEEGLKRHVLYWVMEDIDFNIVLDEEEVDGTVYFSG